MAFPFLRSFISPCERRGLVISWRLLKECNGRGVGWGEVRRRVIGYDSSTGLVIFEAGDLDEVEVREQNRGRDRTKQDRTGRSETEAYHLAKGSLSERKSRQKPRRQRAATEAPGCKTGRQPKGILWITRDCVKKKEKGTKRRKSQLFRYNQSRDFTPPTCPNIAVHLSFFVGTIPTPFYASSDTVSSCSFLTLDRQQPVRTLASITLSLPHPTAPNINDIGRV